LELGRTWDLNNNNNNIVIGVIVKHVALIMKESKLNIGYKGNEGREQIWIFGRRNTANNFFKVNIQERTRDKQG